MVLMTLKTREKTNLDRFIFWISSVRISPSNCICKW